MHVRVENICFDYPGLPVLNEVSLAVPRGEFLSILGPNGSGKSTLLRIIARTILPREGAVFLEDRPLNTFSRRHLAKHMGYVPQETHWLFPFTVMEVVLMGRTPFTRAMGFESRHDVEIAREVMKLTDIDHLADKPITSISGGERQRVLIARALVQEPSLLLLDEPNAHLDLSHQSDIFRILSGLHRDRNLTIIWVSHDLNLAAAYSSRVLLLGGAPGNPSRVVALGPPGEVLTADAIKNVFRAEVTVDSHPRSSRPRIFLNSFYQ
jgi:iron complex transport system ATP-binding protein